MWLYKRKNRYIKKLSLSLGGQLLTWRYITKYNILLSLKCQVSTNQRKVSVVFNKSIMARLVKRKVKDWKIYWQWSSVLLTRNRFSSLLSTLYFKMKIIFMEKDIGNVDILLSFVELTVFWSLGNYFNHCFKKFNFKG